MSLKKVSEFMIDDKFTDKVNNHAVKLNENAGKITEVDQRLTQQLAQTNQNKADKNEVNSQLSVKRDKRVSIGLRDIDTELLAAIEGGEGTQFILESVPRAYSVSPSKTTFARKGKNLFSGVYTPNMIISGSPSIGGSWVYRNGAVSAIIEVEKGSTYTISKSNDSDRFGVGATVGIPHENDSVRYALMDHSGTSYTITMQGEENHILVYLSSEGVGIEPSWLQVEKGSVKTEYESPFVVSLELSADSLSGKALKNRSISIEKTDFIIENEENLFNGEYYARTASLGGNHATILPSDGLKKSAILEIEGGETYSINTLEVPSRFVVSTFDRNPDASGIVPLSFQNLTPNGISEAVVETPKTATHMLVHVAEFGDVPKKLIITKTNTPQKPYVLDSKLIQMGENTSTNPTAPIDRTSAKNIGYITDIVLGNYAKRDTPDYKVSDITTGNPLTNTYALWDELVTVAPDYVKKTLMWNETVESLPVYKYTFEPPKPLGVGLNNLNTIKILVIGNIHGHETYANLPLINFFTDLVKEWVNNDVLQLLRWNIQFDVFPAYNPYGLRHLTRVNGNGVDLNSNFSYNWAIRDELGSSYYSGSSAMSEHENKQFELYLDNLPYQYDFAFDMHHNGNYAGNFVSYTRTLNEDINRILFGVANQMNGFLHKEYPHLATGNSHKVSFESNSGTGRLFQYFQYKKIPGTIFEITPPGNNLTSEDSVKIAVTSIGNIFLNVVRNINNIKIIE